MKAMSKKACSSCKSESAAPVGRGVLAAPLPARHCTVLRTASPVCTKAAISKTSAVFALALMLVGADAFAATLAPANNVDPKAGSSAKSALPAASSAQPQTHFAPAAQMRSPVTPASGEEDIRDIRSPKHLPAPWLWVVYLGGALFLAAAAFAAWCWHLRDRLVKKLPYEIALDRLEEARRFMAAEQAREFCTEVSEIIRGYIELRFSVRAAHRTTEEFLHDLLEEKQDKLVAHRTSLSEFLQHCDLAKFALWQFSVSEMEAMHGSARAFVLQSAIDAVAENNSQKTTALPKSPRVHLDSPAPAQVHATPRSA